MNRERFMQVFLEHRTMLYAFVHTLVRDPHGTEDVFQETCLALIRDSDRFEEGTDFGAWARSVARNRVKEYFRKRKKGPLLSDDAVAALAVSYDEIGDGWWDDRLEAVRHCVEKLSASGRKIVELHYNRAMKSHEIADAVRSSATAVRSALVRIRDVLRMCVSKYLEEGAP